MVTKKHLYTQMNLMNGSKIIIVFFKNKLLWKFIPILILERVL